MQNESYIDEQPKNRDEKVYVERKVCAPCLEKHNIRVGKMKMARAPERNGKTLERLERYASTQTTGLGLEALTGRFYVKRAKTS